MPGSLDAIEHPLLDLSPRGRSASPMPLQPQQSGTQEVLEALAETQQNATVDRSRSQSKRRHAGSRSDSVKKQKMAEYFNEYQKNAATLKAMGMDADRQLKMEEGLTDARIIVRQRQLIAKYNDIHVQGRGGSVPPSKGGPGV